jgi:hypothetical protein
LVKSITKRVVGLVDELVKGVKQVNLDVWFWGKKLVFQKSKMDL